MENHEYGEYIQKDYMLLLTKFYLLQCDDDDDICEVKLFNNFTRESYKVFTLSFKCFLPFTKLLFDC